MHADIGGGYPEDESGPAKYPLQWMVDEARNHGLTFRERMVDRLVKGENPKNVDADSDRFYAAPSAGAKLHNSLTFWWSILEYLPKGKKSHDDPAVKKKGGVYLPLKEKRYIPDDALIHSSVLERVELDGGYDPDNLPDGWRDNVPTDQD